MGAEFGHRIEDTLRFVSIKTYKRRPREQRGGEPDRVDRRRVITDSIRALILRLAREDTGCGVRRIVGELKKMSLPSSRSTVRRVLVDEGLLPDPDRRAPKGIITLWRILIDTPIDPVPCS